ncbi:MAG: hypothetical protein LIO87_10280 [Eubacterium sp.]|nr:hypothetical protein [Eubacterium sp.]MCC8159755.1 hypothetical protein [Oscillospiraceae bacterium]
MEKTVIIINGKGGAGKDTLCDIAAKHYKVRNVSAITPIKEIAKKHGWNGEKDSKSRKFLSDLKKVFIEYNDLPTQYLLEQYEQFMQSEEQLMFVHIREGSEIDKLKHSIKTKCRTLLIRRAGQESWGNASDDEVEQYGYDLYYDNDKPLEETENDFIEFLNTFI